MTTEKGSLKDWDDRHYQSIDDLPPEAWDSVRDKQAVNISDATCIIGDCLSRGLPPSQTAQVLIAAGFKRD